MPYGQDAKLALAFQNSRGTAANISSAFLIPFLSESIQPNVPELLSNNMEGRYDEGEAYAGARQVNGTIVSESQPITAGVFLKALMGNPTTVTSGSVRTHTFKPRTADFSPDEVNVPMTCWKNMADASSMLVYRDLVAVRGQFSVNNGEFLQMTLDALGGVIGDKVSSASLGSAVGKKWTWDVTSTEVGGAASSLIQTLNLSIDEQASPRWALKTSKDPDRVKRDGRRMIRISGTMKYTNQSEYDKFLALTTQALRVTLTGPTEIQSGFFEKLVITVPAFKYLAYPMGFPDASEKLVAFEGKAEFHTGSDTSIAITLVNTLAAY